MLIKAKDDIWINTDHITIIQRNTISESPRVSDLIHKITLTNNKTIELKINEDSENLISRIMELIGTYK